MSASVVWVGISCCEVTVLPRCHSGRTVDCFPLLADCTASLELWEQVCFQGYTCIFTTFTTVLKVILIFLLYILFHYLLNFYYAYFYFIMFMSMCTSYRMSINVRAQPWELVLSTVRDSGTKLKSSGLRASVRHWHHFSSPHCLMMITGGGQMGKRVLQFGLVWFLRQSLYSPG